VQTTAAIMFGVALGLLIAAVYALVNLARYVQSDTASFVKWLDRADPGAVA
jgi:hypothetical protein